MVRVAMTGITSNQCPAVESIMEFAITDENLPTRRISSRGENQNSSLIGKPTLKV